MDQKEEIKLQEEQIKEEDYKSTKQDETNKQHEAAEKENLDKVMKEEEKVIQVCQDNQLPGVVEERNHDNAAETGGQNQLQAAHPAQAAATLEESQKSSSSRKPSQGSKRSLRLKSTVPQPFSFATENRMTRGRRSVDWSSLPEKKMPKETRGSVDLKDSQPKLTNSVSLVNLKTRPLPGPAGFGETSKLKHTNSTAIAATKTSSNTKISTAELRGEKKIENTSLKNKKKIVVNNREVESRSSQVNAKKQQVEEKEKNKLRQISTFKAAPPLPSFYHRKDSPSNFQTNKNPTTGAKSPILGQKSKSMPDGDKLKLEEKDKATASSRRLSSSGAKETITKLFRSTKRTLNIGSKETAVKGVVASA